MIIKCDKGSDHVGCDKCGKLVNIDIKGRPVHTNVHGGPLPPLAFTLWINPRSVVLCEECHDQLNQVTLNWVDR